MNVAAFMGPRSDVETRRGVSNAARPIADTNKVPKDVSTTGIGSENTARG
jgi:hypothetical protein